MRALLLDEGAGTWIYGLEKPTDEPCEGMDGFEQNSVDRIGYDFRRMAVDNTRDIGILIVNGRVY